MDSELLGRLFNLVLDVTHQDNAIYNLLPDIISRLSDPERGMTSEDFNTIMKWVAWLFSMCLVLFAAFVHTEQDSAGFGQIVTCFFFLRSFQGETWQLFYVESFVSCCILCVCIFFRQLFSYITKERQTESLVEKLCQRFRTAKWVNLHLSFFLILTPLTCIFLCVFLFIFSLFACSFLSVLQYLICARCRGGCVTN